MAAAAIEEAQATGIVLSMTPTLVRVCFVMLALEDKDDKLKKTLKTLMVGIAFLTPLITCMPMTILNQIFADRISSLPWLSISFWLIPIAWIAILIHRRFAVAYWGFLALYLGHLLVIMLVIVTSQGGRRVVEARH